MKNLTLVMIAVWSFIGLAIIAAIIFFTVFPRDVKEGGFTEMAFTKTDTSDMQIAAEETIPMSGIKKIELELFSDSCNIYFTDSDNIEMKHYARNISQEQYARTQLLNDTLYISTKPQGFRGFLSFDFMSRSIVDILLPEAYREEIFVNLSSGDVRFYGDTKLSALSVKISSGSIRTNNAVEVQSLDVTVTSGSVKLQGGVKADHYDLKTSSGNLTVSDSLIGSGNVNVTSGTVKLAGVDITESLNVKISSGNITVGIAGDPGLNFNGKTSSGTVRTYFNADKNGKNLSATVGEAPYKDLNVQATSGTIRIIQD